MKKLQGKDLINVGIFTAIYFVVFMAVAMLGLSYFFATADCDCAAYCRHCYDAVLF